MAILLLALPILWMISGMWGYGGMMGGYGMIGGNTSWMLTMHEWMTTSGGMHTLVWDSLAKTLGLTTDELYAELNGGKTLAQIGEEKGVSRADLAANLESAVKSGLAKAVEQKALTQEQADWMLDNMGQGGMMSGFGGSFGSGGCHGNWSGANPALSSKP